MVSALLMACIAYIIVGALAGILAGLLGIGGGLVTVPCLFAIFYWLDFPQAYLMHLAIGTSLAAMVLNTFSSAWSHHRHHMVLWNVFKMMVPGALLGAIAGAYLADKLSGVVLEILFGIGAILLGLRFLLEKRKHSEGEHPLPHFTTLTGVSFLISAVSNILGVGGGMFTVPALLYFRVGEKKSIGTSAAMSFLISLLGALAYLYFGMGDTDFQYTFGYLNFPAFIIIGIVSFFTAPYGVKLTQRLDPGVLRRIFGAALMLTGLSMLIL